MSTKQKLIKSSEPHKIPKLPQIHSLASFQMHDTLIRSRSETSKRHLLDKWNNINTNDLSSCGNRQDRTKLRSRTTRKLRERERQITNDELRQQNNLIWSAVTGQLDVEEQDTKWSSKLNRESSKSLNPNPNPEKKLEKSRKETTTTSPTIEKKADYDRLLRGMNRCSIPTNMLEINNGNISENQKNGRNAKKDTNDTSRDTKNTSRDTKIPNEEVTKPNQKPTNKTKDKTLTHEKRRKDGNNINIALDSSVIANNLYYLEHIIDNSRSRNEKFESNHFDRLIDHAKSPDEKALNNSSKLHKPQLDSINIKKDWNTIRRTVSEQQTSSFNFPQNDKFSTNDIDIYVEKIKNKLKEASCKRSSIIINSNESNKLNESLQESRGKAAHKNIYNNSNIYKDSSNKILENHNQKQKVSKSRSTLSNSFKSRNTPNSLADFIEHIDNICNVGREQRNYDNLNENFRKLKRAESLSQSSTIKNHKFQPIISDYRERKERNKIKIEGKEKTKLSKSTKSSKNKSKRVHISQNRTRTNANQKISRSISSQDNRSIKFYQEYSLDPETKGNELTTLTDLDERISEFYKYKKQKLDRTVNTLGVERVKIASVTSSSSESLIYEQLGLGGQKW